jgi:hypothetical protein
MLPPDPFQTTMEDAMTIRKDLLLHFFVGAITTGALAALLLLFLPAVLAVPASVLTTCITALAWELVGKTEPALDDWVWSVAGAIGGVALTTAWMLS